MRFKIIWEYILLRGQIHAYVLETEICKLVFRNIFLIINVYIWQSSLFLYFLFHVSGRKGCDL